ncbi:MAG: hypothetical protein VKL42_04995 [Snowella sp.]|nr:hypothetical protein [Snowella sp.]
MFNKNDYETPDNIAKAMAKLILPTDRYILEPCAGTGQIVKALLKVVNDDTTILANEISKERFRKLCQINKVSAKCNDFLYVDSPHAWDLIITNPPFDYALEFIAKSLTLLNDKPESRLLFLMPIDTFSSQGRANQLQELDCHISKIHIIPGRIDYLKDGVPMSKCQKEIDGVPQFKNGKPVMCSGRQVSDAVFEIKKGKGENFTFLNV